MKESTMEQFRKAWDYLVEHDYFCYEMEGHDPKHCPSGFMESLSICVVQVNPDTERIEGDDGLNTSTRVWLETGWIKPSDYDRHGIPDDWREGNPYGMLCHDIDLDVGAPTFEEAIIKMADKLKEKCDG